MVSMIGMRYPYELNMVADPRLALQALIPKLQRKTDRSWRETIENNVADWWKTMQRQAMTDSEKPEMVNPMRLVWELSARESPPMRSSLPIPGRRPTGTPVT